MPDPHNLQRFVEAQERVYDRALEELRRGRKESHWMWFIFPQLKGLGHSGTADYYGIASRDEARAYLSHPVLGSRLRECLALVSSPSIFPYPDDLKFRSCLTLFARAGDPACAAALERHFAGAGDPRTDALLKETNA
jgi:uncharacterized protein (DUF1810 family)